MQFPFLYKLISYLYHLSSPLAPLWVEIDICLPGLFFSKFDAEKLLFEAFSEYGVFLAAFSPKVNVFFHFCTI